MTFQKLRASARDKAKTSGSARQGKDIWISAERASTNVRRERCTAASHTCAHQTGITLASARWIHTQARTHARNHARTHARTHEPTHACTRARTHARTHARTSTEPCLSLVASSILAWASAATRINKIKPVNRITQRATSTDESRPAESNQYRQERSQN